MTPVVNSRPDRDAERYAEHVATVPTSARRTIERALTCSASPRAAIKAKCLDCSHLDRAEITACTVIQCPLHPYRPFQNARKGIRTASYGEISDESADAPYQTSPSNIEDEKTAPGDENFRVSP